MEKLEKVERLRERANVTYEEAREALEACEWDLLDAMVYLEKAGKTQAPKQETYSTSYEEQPQFTSVKDKVEEQEKEREDSGFIKKMGHLLKLFWEKCVNNSFRVSRKGEEVIRVPLWALVLAFLLSWKLTLVALVAALFFGCRYSFEGKDDMEGANDAMEKVRKFTEKVKEEYEKL